MESELLIRKLDYQAGKITATELAWHYINFAADNPITELVPSLEKQVAELIFRFSDQIQSSKTIPRTAQNADKFKSTSIRLGAKKWMECLGD